MSQRRATPDAALPEELRTDASARNYPTPNPVAVRPPAQRRAVEVRGTTRAMRRLTRGSTGATAGLLVAIALLVGAFVSDVDNATRSFVVVLGALVLLMAGYKLLRTWTGSAKTDRSGSTRTARNERDAKQRAAAAASGQALPAQLQRRSRRQSVSGLLPTSGDEGE